MADKSPSRLKVALLTPVFVLFGALAFLPVSYLSAKCDSLIQDLR